MATKKEEASVENKDISLFHLKILPNTYINLNGAVDIFPKTILIFLSGTVTSRRMGPKSV